MDILGVTVRPEGSNSPESVSKIVVVVGGSAGDDPPETHAIAFNVFLDELDGAAWATSWSTAQDDVLEISYEVTVQGPARVVAHRGGNKLRIRGGTSTR